MKEFLYDVFVDVWRDNIFIALLMYITAGVVIVLIAAFLLLTFNWIDDGLSRKSKTLPAIVVNKEYHQPSSYTTVTYVQSGSQSIPLIQNHYLPAEWIVTVERTDGTTTNVKVNEEYFNTIAIQIMQ
jgi:hypothetical protein